MVAVAAYFREILLTPETLVDIDLGISHLAEANPAKAAEVREWFKLERHSYRMVSDYSGDFHQALVRLLSRKAIQNHWSAQASATRFKVRQSIWVAAAAISHEVPIATLSPRLYSEIDRNVALPGVYDPATQIWHSRIDNSAKRRRPRKVLAETQATLSANT
ncbi:hypothetical protein [Agrobacterium rosae]|uniref:hypothetical protein n=1 Tax=Agrobacterium rosae TaxID=1972867 RepID=UPI003B9F3F06